jgi:hypothetical protein
VFTRGLHGLETHLAKCQVAMVQDAAEPQIARQSLALNMGHRELPVLAGRKHPAMTEADGELKERVSLALRELTRRPPAEKPGECKPGLIETIGRSSAALRTT